MANPLPETKDLIEETLEVAARVFNDMAHGKPDKRYGENGWHLTHLSAPNATEDHAISERNISRGVTKVGHALLQNAGFTVASRDKGGDDLSMNEAGTHTFLVTSGLTEDEELSISNFMAAARTSDPEKLRQAFKIAKEPLREIATPVLEKFYTDLRNGPTSQR